MEKRSVLSLKKPVTVVPYNKKNTVIINDNKPKPMNDHKDMTKWLLRAFPKAFNNKNKRPLKVNIHEDIIALFPQYFKEIDDATIKAYKALLKQSLYRYTNKISYQSSITKGTHRIDLKGVEIAELDDVAKNKAREVLKGLYERKKLQGKPFVKKSQTQPKE